VRMTVRFFAMAREVMGTDSAEYAICGGATVKHLSELLFRECPALEKMRLRFAVNSSYAAPNTVLQDGDEVACIPPVGGG